MYLFFPPAAAAVVAMFLLPRACSWRGSLLYVMGAESAILYKKEIVFAEFCDYTSEGGTCQVTGAV